MDLLAKDKSFTIHQRNIQSLVIEVFKVKRNFSNVIMCNILKPRTVTYNLWSQTDFMRDCIDTRRYGPNSLSYSARKIWNIIPLEIKNINSLQKFKTEGVRKNCSCYISRPYIQSLGFVDLV